MYYKRFAVFKRNLKTVDQLNKYEQGSARYGITEFADMTSKKLEYVVLLKKTWL